MLCMKRSEQHGSALESLLCSRKASLHTIWYMLWWEHAKAGWGILSWDDPGSPPPTELTTTWHQFLYQLTAYCLLWLEGSSIFAETLSVSFPAIPTPDIGTLPPIQRMSIKCVSWGRARVSGWTRRFHLEVNIMVSPVVYLVVAALLVGLILFLTHGRGRAAAAAQN